MKRYTLALVLMALPFGCTELTPIEAEGCGNRVINANEDCDTVSPFATGTCALAGEPNACFFRCDEETACPDDGVWECGGDGRCRRPSGEFALVVDNSTFVEDFVVGDVDGDGIPDVIGTDGINLSVRYGDGAGGFDDGFIQGIPQPTGELTFTRFDDDELLDALVPMASGFYTLKGTTGRTVEPFNYAPFPVVPNEPQGMAPQDVRAIPVQAQPTCDYDADELGVLTVPNPEMEHLLVADTYLRFAEIHDPMEAIRTPGMPRQSAGDLALNVGTADLDDDGDTEIVLAFAGDTAVHFYSAEGSAYEDCEGPPLKPVAYQATPSGHSVVLPMNHRVHEQGVQLVDMDNDLDLDLLIAVERDEGVGMPHTNHVFWSPNQGDGTFIDNAVRVPFFCDRFQGASLDDEAKEEVCFEIPWPLASGDFDGDNQIDYVFSDEIVLSRFVIPPNTTVPPNPPPMPQMPTELPFETVGFPVGEIEWSEAVVLDFNGDGHLDVVAGSNQDRGVDVFLNAANPLVPGYFNPFRLQTDEPIKNLIAGDFDGDRLADAAFLSDEFGADRLSVVYGAASDGPSEVIDMGDVGAVDSIASTSILIGPGGYDLIDDLFYVSRPYMRDGDMQGPVSLALMFGDASRTMLSPFLIELAVEPDDPGVYPSVALSGQFATVGMAPDNPRDIALIYTPDEDEYDPFLTLMVGVGPDGNVIFQEEQIVGLPPLDTFNTRCALWTVGELVSGLGDVIIGVDNGPTCGEEAQEVNRLMAIPFLGDLVPGGMPRPPQEPLQFDNLPVVFHERVDLADVMADVTVAPGQEVRRVELVNMDEDDDLDLLMVLSGYGNTGTVIVSWNDPEMCTGDRPLCPERVAVIPAEMLMSQDPDLVILDAAPMQSDGDDEPELMIITERDLFILDLDIVTDDYNQLPPRPYGEDIDGELDGAVRTGDLNGDGLIDIVANTQDRLRVLLHQEHTPLGADGDFLTRDDDDDDGDEE